MKLWHILAVIVLSTTVAFAAEVVPPTPAPEKGTPSEPPAPSIDPGIQRRPSTVPDPRSAVPPPNVDPEMAVNPDTAPPALEGGNTPRGPDPKDKRPR